MLARLTKMQALQAHDERAGASYIDEMGARRCPYTPGTFRAVKWAEGPIWIACHRCRRYVELLLTSDIAERQVKSTSFSCSECGAACWIVNDNPAIDGYRLDPRDNVSHHPRAIERLRSQPKSAQHQRPARNGRPTF